MKRQVKLPKKFKLFELVALDSLCERKVVIGWIINIKKDKYDSLYTVEWNDGMTGIFTGYRIEVFKKILDSYLKAHQ